MQRFFLIVLFLTAVFLTGYGQDASDAHRQQELPAVKPAAKPLGNANINANRVPNRLKKLEEIKSAYMAKKLDLTPAQAEKFWPIWYQYQLELVTVQQQIRLNNSAATSNGADQVQNELLLEQKRSAVKMHFNTEFLKLLPLEKVSQIYKSEREFNDELIKAMRGQKNDGEN